jgi:hypothetical protein
MLKNVGINFIFINKIFLVKPKQSIKNYPSKVIENHQTFVRKSVIGPLKKVPS